MKTTRKVATDIIDRYVDHFHGGLGEAIAEAIEDGRRCGIEEAAKVADRWAEYYPVKAFPEHGESLDCRAAHHGRHSSKVIAEDIRALINANSGCPHFELTHGGKQCLRCGATLIVEGDAEQ